METKKYNIFEILYITLLFIIAFWLWSVPMHSNQMPFGEHDGAYIFSYGDDMAFKDKTYGITGDAPLSVFFWYPTYNKIYGPASAQYPPPYNMDYAFAQIFGGERILPSFIFIIISCFLGVFSIYLLIRKLYGVKIAVGTSLSILFSIRFIMYYLWGQRHNVFAFTYIPVAIYCLYSYLESFYENKGKIIYLYLYVLLLLATYLIHLSATVFLIPFSLILIIYFSIKYKKLPIEKKSSKHYLILGAISAIIVVLFFNTYFVGTSLVTKPGTTLDVKAFFRWVDRPANNYGTNPIVLNYKDNYMGTFSILFLIAGLVYILIKRRDRDWVIFSGLLTLYLMFHLHLFGLIDKDSYRIARYLIVESYFFYLLIVIGILTLPDYIRFEKNLKKYIKYGLLMVFLILLILTQGVRGYKTLNESYPDIARITPAQLELADWVEQNVETTSALDLRGTLTYPKEAYIQILSRRVMQRNNPDFPQKKYLTIKDIIKPNMDVPQAYVNGSDWVILVDYVVFDYSDLYSLGAQTEINKLQSMEKEVAENATLLYNKNNIKVYKFD